MTPDLGPILRTILASAKTCPMQLVDVDPAAFVAAGSAAADKFDAWVPDSSLWAGSATAAGIGTAVAVPSIASSPVVYALARPAGDSSVQQLRLPTTMADLLRADPAVTPQFRIAVPDPSRSTRSAAGLLTVRASVLPAVAATALTYVVRMSPPALPTASSELMQYAATHRRVVVPVTEHDISAFRNEQPMVQFAEVATQGPRYRLDYPLLSMSGGRATPLDAVIATLTARTTRQALAGDGWTLDSAAGEDGRVPARADVDGVVGDVKLIEKPAKTLALIDISGSMAQQVPGGGGLTRLDYARAAGIRAVQLYPLNSQIGLWTFSRNLSPGQDFQQLLPIQTLGNSSGQQRLSTQLAGITVNADGGTGLYDSVLAAVRQIRKDWDPERFNSVLILSDGQNDDLGSISLADLIRTLKAEQGDRPVPVIGIAFGPDSDVQAMQQISTATGGETYVARDPMQISQIFLQAVGHRIAPAHR